MVPNIYPNNVDSDAVVAVALLPTNGIVISTNPLQAPNALSPMLVTEFGIVTDVSPLQR